MNVLKFLLVMFIALIIGVFGAHNSAMVPVSFYPFNYEISIASFVLFFGAIFFGVLVAGLISGLKSLHWRKLVRQKSREIERLEKEIAELRIARTNQALISQ